MTTATYSGKGSIQRFWGLLLLASLLAPAASQAQKMFAEGSVSYDIAVLNATNREAAEKAFAGATQQLWLKGNKARFELLSPLRNQAILYDAAERSAVLLRENGQEKYMTDLPPIQWKKYNTRFEGARFTPTGDTRQIAGFKAIGAKATLADGTEVTVYYTPDLLPVAKGYDYLFQSLEGLPLQYTLTLSGATLQYTANTLQMVIVNGSRFEKPKTGYKLLEYQ